MASVGGPKRGGPRDWLCGALCRLSKLAPSRQNLERLAPLFGSSGAASRAVLATVFLYVSRAVVARPLAPFLLYASRVPSSLHQ